MIVFSCHADTNFRYHSLARKNGGYLGFLDNFAGVYATMRAYFSGQIQGDHVQIALTEHEETTFEGALRVRNTLNSDDLVVVVDVTGIIGDWDFTIEKCNDLIAQTFVTETLSGFRYRLFEDSPDPIAAEDEVDVYREKCPHSFFLGVPCSGGDYNKEAVYCKESSIEAVSQAIIALVAAYPRYKPLQLK